MTRRSGTSGTLGRGPAARVLPVVRTAAGVGCVILIAAFAALAATGDGVWINLSPSIPIGIYRARHVDVDHAPLQRGTLVAVCLPHRVAAWGRERGYLGRGRCPDGIIPVGKPIFAVAGDTVTVDWRGLTHDRHPIPNTAPLDQDRKGRPLPRVEPGAYQVAPGQLWLVSTRVAESWDSRYYGPVRVADVIAVLRPIWVAGDAEAR